MALMRRMATSPHARRERRRMARSAASALYAM
jgi:hypothetical protein